MLQAETSPSASFLIVFIKLVGEGGEAGGGATGLEQDRCASVASSARCEQAGTGRGQCCPTPPTPPPPPPPFPPSAEPFPAAFPPSPPAASSENPAPAPRQPATEPSPEVLQTTAKSSPPPGTSFEEQYNAAWASYQQQMLLASMARWLGQAEEAGTDSVAAAASKSSEDDGGAAVASSSGGGGGASGGKMGSRTPVTPPKSSPVAPKKSEKAPKKDEKAKTTPFMHQGHWMRGYRHCRVLIIPVGANNKGSRVLNLFRISCPSFTSQATAAARRTMSGRASARTHSAGSTGVRTRDRWGGRLENDSRLHLW